MVDAQQSPDASADAQLARCDPSKPFADIKPIPGVNSADFDENPSLSPDELTIYFASNRQSPGTADGNIYVANRASRDDVFNAAAALGTVNTGADERGPSISSDGLSLFLHSSRGTSYDLFVSTRANTAASFGAPTALSTDIDTTATETSPVVAANGQVLYFDRSSTNVSQLWRATLGPTGFGSPTMVTELDTANAYGSAISADGLTIYFSSDRTGSQGSTDIWFATRAHITDPFGSPTNLAELNTGDEDRAGWVSPDNCRLYFWSGRPGGSGGFDLWQATRPQ